MSMLYRARTDRVVTPVIADLFIDVGFGVWVRRRVTFAGATVPDKALWDEAKHASVVLIGGKSLWVELSPENREPQMTAKVYTQAKNPLPGMQLMIGNVPHLDVGKYMHWLKGVSYRRDTVTGHLGGASGAETQ